MDKILIKGKGLRNFNRHPPYPDGSAEPIQRSHHLPVKRRNRHWPEGDRRLATVACPQQEQMVEEVEIDLQHSPIMRHERSR